MLVVLSLAAFAAAQSYTITDLGPGSASAINSLGDVLVQPYGSGNSFVWSPGGSLLALAPLPGDDYTTATGINRQDLAVGESYTFNGASATLWTNGVPLDLGMLPRSKFCSGTGIAVSMEVAGYCIIPPYSHAFVWTKATGMQGLGSLPGGGDSAANAINRYGQVAGYSAVTGNQAYYAFIWSRTAGMKSLGKLPGYDSSVAHAINDLGQVAGESDCLNCSLITHATLWSKGKGSILDLGVLSGATFSIALGINNVGQVVGYSSNDTRAFVWSPSTGMLDLNNLIPANSGWVLEFAYAINDLGQIVGYGTLNGQLIPEAFLLTPQ
jgi:probable HAF family extracellular repeat protein